MARVKLNRRNVRKRKTKKISIFLIAILVIAVVLASLYLVYGNSLLGFLTGNAVAATQPAVPPAGIPAGATSISVEKIPKENCYKLTKDGNEYLVRALPGTTEAALYDKIISDAAVKAAKTAGSSGTVNAEIPSASVSGSMTVAKCLPTTTGSKTYSPEVTQATTVVDETYSLGSLDLDLEFRKASSPPGDSGTAAITYSANVVKSTDPKKNGKITFSLSVNFDSTDSKGNRDNSNKLVMFNFQSYIRDNLAGKVMLSKSSGGKDDFFGVILKDFLAEKTEGWVAKGTVNSINGDIIAIRDATDYNADLAAGGASFSNKDFSIRWNEKLAFGDFSKVPWTTKDGKLGPYSRAEVMKLEEVFEKLVEERLKQINDNTIKGSVVDSGKKKNDAGVQWQLITLDFKDDNGKSKSSIKNTFDVAGKVIRVDYSTEQTGGIAGVGVLRHAIWNYPSDPTRTRAMTAKEIMDIIDAQEKTNAARK